MKSLSNLLVIVGFCLGTVGAAGFQSPAKSAGGAARIAEGATEADLGSTEDLAWPLLVGGLVLLVVGGVLGRRKASGAGAGDHHAGLADVRRRLEELRGAVEHLERDGVDDATLLREIDELRTGVLFDLGAKSDEFAALVGFDAYAAVWSPFAVCERLLNRCWSMTADGFGAEGREELPLARAAIEAASTEAAKLAA